MAYLRLGHIKAASTGNISVGLKNCINYIFNPEKTNDYKLVAGYNLIVANNNSCAETAYTQMITTKNEFGKPDGRQGYHYKLSFPSTDDISPELAMIITNEFCSRLFPDYECAYAVHTNTAHLHSHIVFNSIDMYQGYKYHYKKGDWAKTIQPVCNEICEKYNLSGLDLNVDEELRLKHRCKKYNKWYEDGNKRKSGKTDVYTNHMIRKDIDECISAATSYNEFLQLMEEKGHVLDDTHKYITVLAPGRKKAARIINFTPDRSTYTKANILKMIAGTYVQMDRNLVKQQLLIDWNEYLNIKGVVHKRIYSVSLAKKEEEFKLASAKHLHTVENINIYREYLDASDKELNIIKKYIKSGFDARSEAISMMKELLPLIKYYKRFKNGETAFKAEYRKVIEIYRQITASGYSLSSLYLYNNKYAKMVCMIDEYKKHIYVEKQICNRLEKQIKEEKKDQHLQEEKIKPEPKEPQRTGKSI